MDVSRFVGRARELERLTAATSAAAVILTGAAGVGKSRLARELLGWADERGWWTSSVTATRSIAAVPFGAVAHLLPGGGEEPSQLDVLRWISAEVERKAAGKRALVTVDDAHVLDDASATLLHQLAVSRRALVVVTVRAGERLPDAISDLVTHDGTERIELGPLAVDDVHAVLTTWLEGPVEGATVHRLWERSGGNALFLRELVTTGVSDGALDRSAGVWTWAGPVAVGGALRDLVARRLDAVPASARPAVDVVGMAEPLPVHLLAAIAGWDAIDELERAGVVRSVTEGRRTVVRLAHPLYADVVRGAIGVARRRAVAGELATALAASPRRRREDLLRLALWSVDAGLPAESDLLVTAARRAASLTDHALAERLARAALPGGGGAAAVELAHALFWQGAYAEAATAAARVADDEPAAVRAAAAVTTASARFWGLADEEGALGALAAAERNLPPGEDRDELLGHRAAILLFAGRPLDALATAGPVMARNRENLAALRALSAAVPAWAICGSGTRAIAEADAALGLVLARAEDEPTAAGSIMVGRCLALWLTGRIVELEELTTLLYDSSVAQQEDALRGVWAFLLGRALLARGRVAAARERLREASAILRRHDAGRILPWCLAAEAQAGAQGGDRAAAGAAADACRAAFEPAVRVYEAELVLAEAWAAGSPGRAVEAADVAAAGGQRAVEALALHEAVRLGDASVAERLAEVAGAVDGALAAGFAAHAAAVAIGDGNALDAAAERFAAIGAALHAAEAWAAAADAHGRAGRAGARLSSLERLEACRAECDGAATPGLDTGATAVVLWLTRREREVAGLAASGLSNRAIADRLSMSMRTVGNHLNRAYGKLGVTGRSELQRIFVPD